MSPLLFDVLSQRQGSGDFSLFVICQGSLRNTRPRFSLTEIPGRGAYLKTSVGPHLYRGPGKGFGIISLFQNTGKRSELDRGFFHAASYPIHLIIVSQESRIMSRIGRDSACLINHRQWQTIRDSSKCGCRWERIAGHYVLHVLHACSEGTTRYLSQGGELFSFCKRT